MTTVTVVSDMGTAVVSVELPSVGRSAGLLARPSAGIVVCRPGFFARAKWNHLWAVVPATRAPFETSASLARARLRLKQTDEVADAFQHRPGIGTSGDDAAFGPKPLRRVGDRLADCYQMQRGAA